MRYTANISQTVLIAYAPRRPSNFRMSTKRKKLVLAGLLSFLLLCVVMWMFFSSLHWNQREKVTLSVLRIIGSDLEDYKKKHGQFPSSQEGLKAIYPNEGIAVEDGWRQRFVYSRNERPNDKPFNLYSIGANGIDESGSGDDLDFWKLKRTN